MERVLGKVEKLVIGKKNLIYKKKIYFKSIIFALPKTKEDGNETLSDLYTALYHY